MNKTRTTRLTDFVVGAIAIILTEFFGWRYFGPLSIRNFGLLIVVAFLVIRRWQYSPNLFRSFRFLIIYYVFVAILGFFNGLYLSSGATLVFARFLPTVVLFCLITYIIQDESSLTRIVFFLLALNAFDAVVTILQGIGSPLGWEFFSFFQNPELLTDIGDVDGSIGYSIASGINGSVVSNGFFLTAVGLLFWFPYYKKRTVTSFFFSIAISLLCIVALFFNQQRLSFYVYLIFTLITLFSLLPYNGKIWPKVLLVLLTVIVIVWGLDYLPFLDAGRLANVTGYDISERHIAHRQFYHDFLPHHFLTGDRHEFVKLYGQTPHNIFIETLLLGGIGGLLLFSAFLFSFGIRCFKGYLKHKRVCLLFALPIIAILLISWEHSTGFHTGMSLGAYLFALYERSLQIYN